MSWERLSLGNFALDIFISCKKNCSSLLYTFHVLQLHIVWESLRNTSRGAVVQIFVTEKLYDEVLGMSFDFYNCVVLLFLACGQVLGFIWFKLTHLRLKTSRVLGLSIKLTYLRLIYKLNSDDQYHQFNCMLNATSSLHLLQELKNKHLLEPQVWLESKLKHLSRMEFWKRRIYNI